MDDIEDMANSAYPGFHPRELRSAVSIGRRKASQKQPFPADAELPPLELVSSAAGTPPGHVVPGIQTIYVKTFGCSHNQSDSEYMSGQLSAYGYYITEEPNEAHLWLINTCTVKNPSQSAMETLIRTGKDLKKPLVIAGCVPQGDSRLKDLDGVSIVGVQQIDRVVEVVEETLKGHEVRLLRRRALPSLDLPKVDRVRSVITDGVKEIWLSSEDTGAYGRDLGTDLPTLLRALVAELPEDRSTMLRIGMTNPPYILQHLKAIGEILQHPCIYAFLHVPVQSGSDAVLKAMKREYTVTEFRQVADTLLRLVPNIHFATDIICGFPGETVEDFEQTIRLIEDYKFAEVHISQFYPRPGTPAARMKKVPTAEVKKRSRRLTSIFESFSPFKGMEGRIERVWVTDVASDGIHLVGHTKSYVQVLLPAGSVSLGSNYEIKISSIGRWSVMGEPLHPRSDVSAKHESQLKFWKQNSFISRIRSSRSAAVTCSDDCACISTGSKKLQARSSGSSAGKHFCTSDQSNASRSSMPCSRLDEGTKDELLESASSEKSQSLGRESDDAHASEDASSGIAEQFNTMSGSSYLGIGKLASQRESQTFQRVKALSFVRFRRIWSRNDESRSFTGESRSPFNGRLTNMMKTSMAQGFFEGRWSCRDWAALFGILAALVGIASVILVYSNFN